MNNGMIRRRAARLSLGLSVVFLALLATLHVLEPEFNSGHVISEYQLGDYGFLMSLAFCILGVSALLLAVSLGPRRTRWLVVVTRYRRRFFYRGCLSPGPDAPHRRLPARHIRTCRHFRLADCVHLDRWKFPQQRTRVSLVPATMGATPSVGRFRVVSRFFTVIRLMGQTDTPLPAWVSLANRFMIVTYCIWFMAAAWGAARKRPSTMQSN